MPLVATAQPGNVPPRVQLEATGLAGTTTTILRLDPDGRTRTVRTAEPATLTSGYWLGFDYEAPLGAPVTYRTTDTTPVTAGPVTLDATLIWLVHPGVPARSISILPELIGQVDPRSRAARSGVMQPLGRQTPVVVSEPRASSTFGIRFLTETVADIDRVWTLIADGAALLLNIPPVLGWGLTWQYVNVGDVQAEDIGGIASGARVWTFPLTVVDRPIGAQLAQWTYATMLTDNTLASYADVMTKFGTYSNLQANERS